MIRLGLSKQLPAMSNCFGGRGADGGDARGDVRTDAHLAGWWVRALAYILDWCLAGIPSFVLIEVYPQGTPGRLIGYLLIPSVTITYGAILIGHYGRTVGMRLLHIRAIDGATGRTVARRDAWVRALTAFALYGLTDWILLLVEWGRPTGWSSHHHPIVGTFEVVQLVLDLTLLMPIWDTNNQTLQDKSVGSIVVEW